MKVAAKVHGVRYLGMLLARRVSEVIHCGPAKVEKAMTGRAEMGGEIKVESMCDKKKKRAGWRDRNFCSRDGVKLWVIF